MENPRDPKELLDDMMDKTQNEANEDLYWKLNVSLSSNVEEAYFSSLGADDLPVAMIEKALKAASNICPRNSDTEEFHFDMCLYYLNAATYGFVDAENETPAQVEAANRMTAFETKFNKVVRKAFRAA